MIQFLIWSNQQAAWWRPAKRGYTPVIELAGRYSRDEATGIVSKATLDGALDSEVFDAMAGRSIRVPTEVMVIAPETILLSPRQRSHPSEERPETD